MGKVYEISSGKEIPDTDLNDRVREYIRKQMIDARDVRAAAGDNPDLFIDCHDHLLYLANCWLDTLGVVSQRIVHNGGQNVER